MKLKRLITFLGLMAWMSANAGSTDVFIVYYATSKGKTGHMGIAVDNYRIVFKQGHGTAENGAPDTVKTGELTYYDLWPDDDDFRVSHIKQDMKAVYYKLPVSSTGSITINSLYDEGIPHKEHYPSDGLLRVRTSWDEDRKMIRLLDSLVESAHPFNATGFNCSDFVRLPMERLLGSSLHGKEFVLTGWSTTPNKLYRELRKQPRVEVVKNADQKAKRSFLGQRVLYKIFHRAKRPSKSHFSHKTT